MKTNSHKQIIFDLLNDNQKHCSDEFIDSVKKATGKGIIDYRARITSIRKDLKKDDMTVHSEPCHNRCGRNHSAGMFVYWIGRVGDKAQIQDVPVSPPVVQSARQRDWVFESESMPGKKHHVVDFTTALVCDCVSYSYRKTCKHVDTVKLMQETKKVEDPKVLQNKLF